MVSTGFIEFLLFLFVMLGAAGLWLLADTLKEMNDSLQAIDSTLGYINTTLENIEMDLRK